MKEFFDKFSYIPSKDFQNKFNDKCKQYQLDFLQQNIFDQQYCDPNQNVDSNSKKQTILSTQFLEQYQKLNKNESVENLKQIIHGFLIGLEEKSEEKPEDLNQLENITITAHQIRQKCLKKNIVSIQTNQNQEKYDISGEKIQPSNKQQQYFLRNLKPKTRFFLKRNSEYLKSEKKKTEQDTIQQQLEDCQIIRQNFNWTSIFQYLADQLKNSSCLFIQSDDIIQLTYLSKQAQSSIMKTVENLIIEINQDIQDINFEIDQNGKGIIYFFSQLYTYQICKMNYWNKLSYCIKEEDQQQDRIYAIVKSSLQNNKKETCRLNAESVAYKIQEDISKQLQEALQRTCIDIIEKENQQFKPINIMRECDKFISNMKEKKIDTILNYIKNPNTLIKQIFEERWKEICNSRLNNFYQKEYLEKEKEQINSIIQYLKDILKEFDHLYQNSDEVIADQKFFFKDYKDKKKEQFDDVTIEKWNDVAKDFVINIFEQNSFEFSSVINDNLKILYQKNVKIKNKIQWSSSLVDEIRKCEAGIFYPIAFIKFLSESLNKKINEIQQERQITDLEFYGLKQKNTEFQQTALGCSEKCYFCKRKCDQEGQNHLHKCSLGHFIRGNTFQLFEYNLISRQFLYMLKIMIKV